MYGDCRRVDPSEIAPDLLPAGFTLAETCIDFLLLLSHIVFFRYTLGFFGFLGRLFSTWILQVNLFQILRKIGKHLDLLTVFNYPKTISSFCIISSLLKMIFFLKCFLQYLYFLFVSGPQSPKKQVVNIFPGISLWVRRIVLSVRPGFKNMVK